MAQLSKFRSLIPASTWVALSLLSACQPATDPADEQNLANTKDPDYFVEPDTETSAPPQALGQTPLAGTENISKWFIVVSRISRNFVVGRD